MKKKTLLLIFLLTILTVFINVNEVKAADITENATYYLNDETIDEKIKDNDERTFIEIKKNDKITIKSSKKIFGIYIVYEKNSTTGTIEINDKKMEIGKNGFLHEFIELNPTKELKINYDNSVKIADIYVIDDGERPDFIEYWEKPLDEEADLLLFSSHFDDDTLYFGGLIPTYIAQGRKIQIVYYTYANPKETYRNHEALHALYKMGVKNYPIIGIVPDEWSDTLDWAIDNMENAGLKIDEVIDFQVEMIRRFKPEVVVSHDENGEYGHGQHRLCTHTLKTALEKTNDPNYHFESYVLYGIWNTPKTYIHLYDKNKITLDYDTPIEYYNGKTAHEIAVLGFEQHKSQHTTVLLDWLFGKNGEIEKASQIESFSPTEFGLYRSLVGNDIYKNDMFENLMPVENNTNNEYYNTSNEKFTIPYLYNTITIILVVLAILLYFEMSPARIYNLLIALKDLIIKEFKSFYKDKNIKTKSTKKEQSEKKTSNSKKNTNTAKKKTTVKKASSSTTKTKSSGATKKASTTTKKKTNSTKTKK